MDFVEYSDDAGTKVDVIGVKLAPFNPTSLDAVLIALEMLCINENDIVYDLGCGDGRFLLESLKKCNIQKGVGIEYDSVLVERAISLCKCREGEENQETLNIIHGNVLSVDFSEATALFIYLVPEGMRALRNQLREMLLKGTRIVSYVFSIPDLSPIRIELFKGSTKLYLYTSESL